MGYKKLIMLNHWDSLRPEDLRSIGYEVQDQLRWVEWAAVGCKFLYVHMHVCKYVCIYMHAYLYACVHGYMCVCMYLFNQKETDKTHARLLTTELTS